MKHEQTSALNHTQVSSKSLYQCLKWASGGSESLPVNALTQFDFWTCSESPHLIGCRTRVYVWFVSLQRRLTQSFLETGAELLLAELLPPPGV